MENEMIIITHRFINGFEYFENSNKNKLSFNLIYFISADE